MTTERFIPNLKRTRSDMVEKASLYEDASTGKTKGASSTSALHPADDTETTAFPSGATNYGSGPAETAETQLIDRENEQSANRRRAEKVRSEHPALSGASAWAALKFASTLDALARTTSAVPSMRDANEERLLQFCGKAGKSLDFEGPPTSELKELIAALEQEVEHLTRSDNDRGETGGP